ncbi:hybrid sensor histidine kinase/response regulator [Shewanella litorisediminis]|uniref:histidine kinase n=1 Tax=Shewanella litorisediminis TaxID=1173586 RepID=A0ABX7G5M7_9GAMM|nr:PAS domain-containing hybrid sensor histidine kinase/response regulator [Shewanella litorisediminis]MCL2917525.1 ATP-binding protein [Shewanella litorisediminis]QRH02654.1 response regulator [Shewanella litorisediminis]
MESGSANMLFDARHALLDPLFLAELGKLQARFIRGEDVILPLCRILAEQSGAQAVLVIDASSSNAQEMPESAACWCRDPVRYLTLWKDVRDWPFSHQDPLVHYWHKFVVWPVKHTDLLVFFHTPKDAWLGFLQSFSELLADILMGILTLHTEHWRERGGREEIGDIENIMFRSIVRNSDDFIMVVKQFHDGNSEIVYANAAVTCISLYPRSELKGMSLGKLFPKGVQASGNDVDLYDILCSGKDFNGEVYCTKANGELAILHLHVVALEQDSKGGLYALIGRDYTEFKAMEKTVSRAQKMQAIGQLVGGIAHDFNNILGVLKGNLELMQLKNKDERLDNYLATALKSCQRGTELTRRLLQFSRQEQFNAQHCQVNEVIEGLRDLFAKSLTSQVTLNVQAAPFTRDVMVDKGDLEDALLNLVINARDAMNGEGALTIATGESELAGYLPGVGERVLVEPACYVWISVTDSGHGIPAQLLDKIFEPFFTTKDKSKGTGLGLSMVYGFVKRSRGYMNVLSTGPQGTEIRLWFPATAIKSAASAKALVTEATVPKVKGPLKALLVDDEPELLKVLRDYCELMGMEVETFSDGVTFRKSFQSKPCDAGLLITDVLMPGGINGYELASETIAKHPMSVLLVSGFIEDIGVNRYEEMPFKVLHKPFDLHAFANALAEVGVSFKDTES